MNYIREETVVTLMGYQISALYRIIMIQSIGKLFSMEIQRQPVKFQTKDHSHTFKKCYLYTKLKYQI